MFLHVDLPLISIRFNKVSRKELRLYLELIEQCYPLAELANNETKADLIKEVFKCKCTKDDLNNLRSFKDITIKKVITMKDNDVKVIKRIRWRSKTKVSKNYIHV
jgi:hypothetical protein